MNFKVGIMTTYAEAGMLAKAMKKAGFEKVEYDGIKLYTVSGVLLDETLDTLYAKISEISREYKDQIIQIGAIITNFKNNEKE